jgi:hypothetical protein
MELNEIQYFVTKPFEKSLHLAMLNGGAPGRNSALAVKAVLGSLGNDDPFKGIVKPTKHGEGRLPHCVKYDLYDGWRLVTCQNEKSCGFLFLGRHEDVDHWLDQHQGQTFAVDQGKAVVVPGVGSPIAYGRAARVGGSPLVELISQDLSDLLLDLPRSIAKRLESLDGVTGRQRLYEIIAEITDRAKASLIESVFTQLLNGNVDGAENRIKLEFGLIPSFDELDELSLLRVQDGPEIRRIKIGSPEYEKWLQDFEKRSTWFEWFLFMHPEQEKVVYADYTEPAQLSGVSGSGKTCVAVRRAVRLAQDPNAKVLLLTLNRSLAGLLGQLVEAVETDGSVRSRIEVTSFFELAQRLLYRLEPENKRIYSDVTWRLGEHVDEIFREYYRQWLNSRAASVLLPLQMSLNAREVSGEVYVREEFDWIRSAVDPDHRVSYLDLNRTGRRFPIARDRRQEILRGLDGWETKMKWVGVVDYLGLTSALSRHLESITPEYANILIDEAQDFGTTELRVVRRLVRETPNDLFLCGDVAQTILPKHRSLTEAGIPTINRERITQNYRNSREILTAAYNVLRNNLHEDLLDSQDLEILDPEFANFSGPLPMALFAESLEEEIAYARTYAKTRLQQGANAVCIGFAGFSARDVGEFAKKCGVTALDGTYDPNTNKLVFSDLEQTKGYEFDVLIIVQCTADVLPPRDAPEEEAHRAACKLYVAMTRAKRELILSFNSIASPWITGVSDSIGVESWSDFEEVDPQNRSGVPEMLPELQPRRAAVNVGRLTGIEFLYTSYAQGLSLEAQQKLADLADGREAIKGGSGKRIKWANVGSLLEDLFRGRSYDQLVGPVVANELRALYRRIFPDDRGARSAT